MSHHAPRGPVKARNPKDGADPMDAPRCTATAKGSGVQCKRRPIPGGAVCVKHGGGAPQVKAAAERRLADLVPKAVEYYDWLLTQRDYPSAGLGAANAVWDREKGRPRESVDMNVTGQVNVIDVLRQRHARAKSLEKMAPVHGTETDAGAD